jgi:hypothetical protein
MAQAPADQRVVWVFKGSKMKHIDEAINGHAQAIIQKLPESTVELISKANHDLYFGPAHLADDEGYPGFSKALRIIRESLDELNDVYVDESGHVSDTEPQGYFDDESGDFIEPLPYAMVDAMVVISKILGAELSAHF